MIAAVTMMNVDLAVARKMERTELCRVFSRARTCSLFNARRLRVSHWKLTVKWGHARHYVWTRVKLPVTPCMARLSLASSAVPT
jgi:hypothetical protein